MWQRWVARWKTAAAAAAAAAAAVAAAATAAAVPITPAASWKVVPHRTAAVTATMTVAIRLLFRKKWTPRF